MSHPHPNTILATHIPDVEWLLGLWLAIHGGDPGPDGEVAVSDADLQQAAIGIIAAVAPYAETRAPVVGVPAATLQKLGVSVYVPAGKAHPDDDGVPGRHCVVSPLGGWCFGPPPPRNLQ